METQERNNITLAAVNAAGPTQAVSVTDKESGEITERSETPAEWSARVADMAKTIAVMCSDNSNVAKAITQIEEAKPFVANIVGGKPEQATTRVIVTVQTKPTAKNPDGTETLRTDRRDNPSGRAMSKKIKQLVGRRAMIWKYNEPWEDGSGKTTRVIAHVEDLGPAKDFK